MFYLITLSLVGDYNEGHSVERISLSQHGDSWCVKRAIDPVELGVGEASPELLPLIYC